MMIQGLTARGKLRDSARQFKGKTVAFTRRTIALLSVGAIIVLPLLAAVFQPDLVLNYGWVQNKGGFWFFSEGRDVMKFITLGGMTILPFHTHTISAIIGLYFGPSSVK